MIHAVVTCVALLAVDAGGITTPSLLAAHPCTSSLLEPILRSSLPKLVSAYPRVSAKCYGTPRIGESAQGMHMSGHGGGSGVILSWPIVPQQQYELTITGHTETGSLSIRTDAGDADSATWNRLSDVPLTLTIADTSTLRLWLYSDRPFDVVITDIRLRRVDAMDQPDWSTFAFWGPQWQKPWIEEWAGIEADDSDLSRVRRIRQRLHESSRLVADQPSLGSGLATVSALQDGGVISGFCGNIGTAAHYLLDGIGIPSRRVDMISIDPNDPSIVRDTHVVAEAFTADRGWVIVDPTFNCDYVDEAGNMLGAEAAHLRRVAGLPVMLQQAEPTRQHRTAGEAALPVVNLLNRIVAPAVMSSGEVVGQSLDLTATAKPVEPIDVGEHAGGITTPSLLVARPYGAGHIVLEGDGETAGLYYEWTLDPDAAYQFTLAADVAMGNVRLRVDAGTEESAAWRSVGPNLIQLWVDGIDLLRVWIYAEEAFRCDVKDLQLRALGQNAPLGEWAFRNWIPDRLRTWVRRWGGFKKDDPPIVIVDRLRQAVHSASNSTDRASSTRYPDAVAQLKLTGDVSGSCGAYALVHLLRATGLQARPVQLGSERYSQGKDEYETHVLVEVFDPVAERWFLADPTFNTQYEDESGRVLGLAELLQRTEDEPWSIRQFTPVKPGRSAAEYYMPVKDLFHMAYTPSMDIPTPNEHVGEAVRWPAGSSFREVVELYRKPDEGVE